MKESLSRIVEWVKKNPLIAALILGAVILLGYLMYKRGGGGGGASGETPTQTPTDAPASDIPAMGDMGSAGGTGGGGTSTQIPTTPGGEVPQDMPIQDRPPSMPVFDSSTSAAWTPQADFTTLTPAPVAVKQSPIAQAVEAHPTLKSAKRPQVFSGISAAVGANPTLAGAAKPGATTKTPAQLAGKPKSFTGLYNGIRYKGGYLLNGLYNGEWYVNGRRAYATQGQVQSGTGLGSAGGGIKAV